MGFAAFASLRIILEDTAKNGSSTINLLVKSNPVYPPFVTHLAVTKLDSTLLAKRPPTNDLEYTLSLPMHDGILLIMPTKPLVPFHTIKSVHNTSLVSNMLLLVQQAWKKRIFTK
jgi:hypothetical protein